MYSVNYSNRYIIINSDIGNIAYFFLSNRLMAKITNQWSENNKNNIKLLSMLSADTLEMF